MWRDLRVQFATCDSAVVLPADCYKDLYLGPEECIKLVVSDCKTTADLRRCFNHTTAELPACCLGRIGIEWVDKYKKPHPHPALSHALTTVTPAHLFLSRYPFPPMDIAGYVRKTLSAYEERVVSADANSWVQFRSECPMQGCVDNEANGEEEQDPRRLMFDTLKGMMKEWSDRTRPVPEFQRAYSPEERATFSSKPKSQSSDVYNHEQGLRDWGPPVPELHRLATNGLNQYRVAELLQAGANPDERDPGTEGTPLHFAAKHGALAIVRTLIEVGADVNAQDETGFSPLILVCSYREEKAHLPGHDPETRVQVMQLLLDAGASTRLTRYSWIKSTSGFTALHYTAIFNHPHLTRVLLTADPSLADVKDTVGWTARDTAGMHMRQSVIEVMDEMNVRASDPWFDRIGSISAKAGLTNEYLDEQTYRRDLRRNQEHAVNQFIGNGAAWDAGQEAARRKKKGPKRKGHKKTTS